MIQYKFKTGRPGQENFLFVNAERVFAKTMPTCMRLQLASIGYNIPASVANGDAAVAALIKSNLQAVYETVNHDSDKAGEVLCKVLNATLRTRGNAWEFVGKGIV